MLSGAPMNLNPLAGALSTPVTQDFPYPRAALNPYRMPQVDISFRNGRLDISILLEELVDNYLGDL